MSKKTNHVRRKAARLGLRLKKLRKNGSMHQEYGPYMLVDAKNDGLVRQSLTLEAALDHLNSENFGG